jgi:NAD(P)-dependent dehydrogenase (short-subunit alcohol dehydrogenase family)
MNEISARISTGSLQGKVALVTGASRGIGRAIAEAYAREGASVVICGRKQETLDEVAHELGSLPGRVRPVACHVGRLEELERLVEAAHSEFGRIDILVNNAGTNIAYGDCLEMTEPQFDKMIDINLKAAFRLTRLVAPGMCERGSGSIINISSVSGLRPQRQAMLYSMTKAALIMMTMSYALELGPRGVRVNAIAPGLVETRLSEFYWKEEARREAALGGQPIHRAGRPEEIAGVALMLATGGSSYLTGQVIVVDGGRLISSWI